MRTPRFAVVVSGVPFIISLCLSPSLVGQRAPRARDLGVPFEGATGALNAITDVVGVAVGHSTIISGEGALEVGEGPVRTGVTAVLPRGRDSMAKPSFAGWYSQNGNGEMTGTAWVEESGFLEGPVMITNTHSVGVVRGQDVDRRLHRGVLVHRTSDGGRSCSWLACRWATRCRRPRRRRPCRLSIPPEAIWDRSSSSWRPTRRSFRTN